ncbi:TPA: hypothetical protein IAC10_04440 [Candidatus Scatousia excrementigallinarum]|uniref:Uncharacterized protein n=1 Tax=Candidatus Scatousia excrementigallinarum TaxID=2840935 RepID=A0A9D1EYM6_9BACT|nr:hypothetical protein [Candidatus Scatousia excrementigallinarum]
MTTIWIIFVVLVCISSMVYTLVNYKKHNAKLAKFAEEHPEAAKVYIKTTKIGIIVDTLTVHDVDGEEPLIFNEMLIKDGFYLIPGKHVLELSYQWTRPGIIYKTITNYLDPCKIEVEAEANKIYNLYYNKKQKQYVFEEIR